MRRRFSTTDTLLLNKLYELKQELECTQLEQQSIHKYNHGVIVPQLTDTGDIVQDCRNLFNELQYTSQEEYITRYEQQEHYLSDEQLNEQKRVKHYLSDAYTHLNIVYRMWFVYWLYQVVVVDNNSEEEYREHPIIVFERLIQLIMATVLKTSEIAHTGRTEYSASCTMPYSIVQCCCTNQYEPLKISDVRELIGTMVYYQVKEAYWITSSTSDIALPIKEYEERDYSIHYYPIERVVNEWIDSLDLNQHAQYTQIEIMEPSEIMELNIQWTDSILFNYEMIRSELNFFNVVQ
jgi:hypothetical protein